MYKLNHGIGYSNKTDQTMNNYGVCNVCKRLIGRLVNRRFKFLAINIYYIPAIEYALEFDSTFCYLQYNKVFTFEHYG